MIPIWTCYFFSNLFFQKNFFGCRKFIHFHKFYFFANFTQLTSVQVYLVSRIRKMTCSMLI
jgi:hypothetical protein